MASKIVEWIKSHRWAIIPSTLEAMIEFTEKRIEGGMDIKIANEDQAKYHLNEIESITALQTRIGTPIDGARHAVKRGRVGIVPVVGPIFPRDNFFTAWSGAVSVDTIARDLQMAMDDDSIDSIILNFDSPGGEITGISELAQFIADCGKRKRTMGYAYGYMASAAYWLGSGLGEIVASQTAEVGSIGVVAVYTDSREKDSKSGVKRHEIVSSKSPKKRADPATDEGRQAIQTIVDELADIFIGDVAANRGVTAEHVASEFGQGGIFIAGNAIEPGMVDRIGTLEMLIEEQNKLTESKQSIYLSGGNNMDEKQFAADHPELYKAIQEAARKAGRAEGHAEGLKAGVEQESNRIKAIMDINVPGAETIVKENMFNAEHTADTISALILKEQQKTLAAKKKEQEDEGADVQSALEQVDPGAEGAGSEEATADEEKAYSDNLKAGAAQ